MFHYLPSLNIELSFCVWGRAGYLGCVWEEEEEEEEERCELLYVGAGWYRCRGWEMVMRM